MKRWFEGKWKIVLAYWLAQSVVLYLATAALYSDSPGDWRDALTDDEYALWVGGACLVVILMQVLFVLPVRRPRKMGERGHSLYVSLGVAGLAIAGLGGALVWTAMDVPYLITDNDPDEDVWAWFFLAEMILVWPIATLLLIRFCRRGSGDTVLGRIAARIFMGTVVEVVAIIPLDVMVRRRDSCYCAQGTFFTLLICGAVGLMALGPAIFLPILARRRKRYYAGLCDACGYDMTGCPTADRCPECGTGWRRPRSATDSA